MVVDLQKAGLWKRIAAWMLDLIAMSVVAVGIGVLLAAILGYDGHYKQLDAAYESYSAQYGVDFNITQEEYEAMSPEDRVKYDEAAKALDADQDARYAYNMLVNESMLIVTLALLIGTVLLEFVIPLWLGNGQTVGKKVFSLGLIRNDGVQVNNMQLFARAVLGKFTLETMIPVYIALMILFGMLGSLGTMILAAIVIVQIIVMGVTRTNSAIHDLIAGTVVVDISSQQIFKNTGELIEYTKRIHAEQAARKEY